MRARRGPSRAVPTDSRKSAMSTDIRVPNLGESVTEATVAQWFKSEGDTVNADEPLLELETDKVTVEVPAPAAGTLSEITAKSGETVSVGALLGQIADGAGGAKAAPAAIPPARHNRASIPTISKAARPTCWASPDCPPESSG